MAKAKKMTTEKRIALLKDMGVDPFNDSTPISKIISVAGDMTIPELEAALGSWRSKLYVEAVIQHAAVVEAASHSWTAEQDDIVRNFDSKEASRRLGRKLPVIWERRQELGIDPAK